MDVVRPQRNGKTGTVRLRETRSAKRDVRAPDSSLVTLPLERVRHTQELKTGSSRSLDGWLATRKARNLKRAHVTGNGSGRARERKTEEGSDRREG